MCWWTENRGSLSVNILCSCSLQPLVRHEEETKRQSEELSGLCHLVHQIKLIQEQKLE